MKGGNYSESQKDGRTEGLAPSQGWGVGKGSHNGWSRQETRGSLRCRDNGLLPLCLASSSCLMDWGIREGHMIVWAIPRGALPPTAPSWAGKDSGSSRDSGVRKRAFVSTVDKGAPKVSCQTSLPKQRNNCQCNTLVTWVHFYLLSCSV